MLHGGVARSTAMVVACQAIRYRVFCGERGFLPGSHYPDQRERDEFDEVATHLAVVERGGNLLGTARIVPHSERGFPLQRYCKARIPQDIESTTAEVSRLAVPRSVAVRYGSPGWTGCLSREVALRLYQTIYHIAKQEGLTHLIAAMAPSLVRVFSAFDISWSPIGPAAEFGGVVRPYVASLAAFDAVKTEAAWRFRQVGTNTISANANTL